MAKKKTEDEPAAEFEAEAAEPEVAEPEAAEEAVEEEAEEEAVLGPIIEKGLPKLKVDAGDEPTFQGLEGTISAKGYPAPGEVIIDVAREDGADHQRFSAYTDEGDLETPLVGVTGPGTWVFHGESPVTQVGEGREDGRQVIRVSGDTKLEVQ